MAVRFAAAICVSLLAVGCIGFGIASAGGGASSSASEFGLSSSNAIEPAQVRVTVNGSNIEGVSEGLVLESATKRDISQGIEEIEAEEEAARIAAEEAARAEELARIAAAEEAKAAAAAKEAPVLSDVDFSCGKEAFLAEWTTRIDAYLAGSPLAGCGAIFAEAAWENGVDPRWSPAISNTESTKGAHCFRPYNAWGWMGSASWTSWDQAIRAHVAGLAEGYGYTISVANARKYCPPTYMDWYRKTVAEMAKI